MNAYVITIQGMPESVTVAERCIATAERVGIFAMIQWAVTPKDGPRAMFEERGWPMQKFEEHPYSKPEPCMATFLSHASLWDIACKSGQPIIVLEHDAVFMRPVPDIEVDGLCNIGRPSFGRFVQPTSGLGPLTSKRYMPGAHAYIVTPEGGRRLLEKATEAEPTDVFLHRRRFPWLQEYYPWPVHCDDSFSTIQLEKGCLAKHNKVDPVAW